jgi:hypothetical protein
VENTYPFSPEVEDAHDAMRGTRRRLGTEGHDYLSPCMENPKLWDLMSGTETWVQFGRRAAVAMELCVTACQVFGECQRLARADKHIHGVIAGRVVLDPAAARARARKAKKKGTASAPAGK